MVSFIFYDVGFLIVFGILAALFFYKHKKNLKRQGWMFLYHSKAGIKFIDWTARKFERILKPMQYFVIGLGYILMVSIIWLIGKSVWIYVSSPIPKQLENLPPIAPLIPYFPAIFNLESLFPPLYFTYFIIALAIVAISHEFSHGIFARLHKIKVKTTGVAFFGPFLGAFVEPDEKNMAKKGKIAQLSILGAGTFANVVMTILFLLIMWLFFSLSFNPAGVVFNVYAQNVVNVRDIISVQGKNVSSIGDISLFAEEGLNKIETAGGDYLAPLESLKEGVEKNAVQIVAFEDAPAVNAKLQGAIMEINGLPVKGQEDLNNVLSGIPAGENLRIKTSQGKEIVYYDIKSGDKDGHAYLGIGFYSFDRGGLGGKASSLFAKVKNPNIYYEPTWDGDFVQFIYDLLWWIVVINILVALMNMLPVSILDGGRFFYLTIWGITGSEKIGRKAFAIATWVIFLLIALMMAKWVGNLVF